MIPKIRAIAIDNEVSHLNDILAAVTSLGIGCLPLLHPRDTAEMPIALFESVRLVFSDLYLGDAEAMSDNQAHIRQVAGQLLALKLKAHSPFVLVIWTSHPQEVASLEKVIVERFAPEERPLAILTLDKNSYGVGVDGAKTNAEKLWQDIKKQIEGTQSLTALLLWEHEVHLAADNAVRQIVEIARKNAVINQISVDEPLDQLLSLLAIKATSLREAQQFPRKAVGEGLNALLLDELQHLIPTGGSDAVWTTALTYLKKPKDLNPTPDQITRLNDALLISRTLSTGAERGSVLDIALDDAGFLDRFGIAKTDMWQRFSFVNKPADDEIVWRLVQIEGTCDSAQGKPGLIPFVLAAEVPSSLELKPVGRGGPNFRVQAVEETPPFDFDGEAKKLVFNFRFFFTLTRHEAKGRNSVYRLRQEPINWVSGLWAAYLTRPGFVAI